MVLMKIKAKALIIILLCIVQSKLIAGQCPSKLFNIDVKYMK